MRKFTPKNDISLSANNHKVVDCASNNHNSCFVRFFISIWTQVKFFFTNAFIEACECSAPVKARSSDCESYPVKAEVGCEVYMSPATNSVGVVDVVSIVREGFHHPYIPMPTTDVNVQRCEKAATEIADKSELIKLSTKPSQYLETAYESLENMEPVGSYHLEVVKQYDENHLFNIKDFIKPVVFTGIKAHTHTSDAFSIVEKIPCHGTCTVEREEERSTKCREDFLQEIPYGFSEVSRDTGECRNLTLLDRLHTELQNGDITQDEHATLTASIIASTLPRNLSNIGKSIGANQLYVWQTPPIYDEWNGIEERQIHSTHSASIFDTGGLSDPIAEKKTDNFSKGSNIQFTLSTEYEKDSHQTCSPDIPVNQKLSADESVFVGTIPYTLDASFDGWQTIPGKRNLCYTASQDGYFLRPKRSSSLKSDQSPDKSLSRKIVRFADSLGMDLATVRDVKNTDRPPLVPASATLDLNIDTEKSFSSLGAKQFQMCFPQPGASATFIHRVLNSFVCLENARVDSSRGILTGTVRVKSMGFEKMVTIRITYNNWATFFEVPASYVQDSHDGTTDRFSFSAVFPSAMVANESAQFAVRYEIHSGVAYWDNNYGQNYRIVCYAKATDIAGDGSWIHYL